MIDSAHVGVRFSFISRRRRDDARRRVDERRTSVVVVVVSRKNAGLGFGQSRNQTSRFRKSSENRRSEDVGKARAAAVVPGRRGSSSSGGDGTESALVRDAQKPDTYLQRELERVGDGPEPPPLLQSHDLLGVHRRGGIGDLEEVRGDHRGVQVDGGVVHGVPRGELAEGRARRALSGAGARRRGRRPPAERLTAVGATAAPASAATAPAATGMGLRFVKSPRQMDEHGEVRRERGRSRRRAAVDVHTTWPSAATLRG